MSSRPFVSSKVVCYAISMAQEARRKGTPTRLSEMLYRLTDEKPRAYTAAIEEAIQEGLVTRTALGYNLTEKGRQVAAHRDRGQPRR